MNEKPRLVEVTAIEAAEIAERSADGDLSTPHLINKVYADADELRAWRQARTTHQSDVEAT